MDLKNIQNYYLSEEREMRIWKEGVFVFDTSSLLGLYFFSKKSQVDIFDTILKSIKDRLWIPGHVEYEYLNNREKAIFKPIDEKYKKIDEEIIKSIKKGIIDLKNKSIELKQRTMKQDIHPYLDKNISESVEQIFQNLNKEFNIVENRIKNEFEKREQEIKSLAQRDTILEKCKELFSVGEEYKFDEIMKIINEGELRYRIGLPPGFKDGEGSNRKDGIQKYGDLIIWKQIIEYAKKVKKPILLITNDVKSDWCYSQKRSNENRIQRPKEDLIREIKDEAGVEFWMYSFSQFLYTANKLLDTKVAEEVIEESQNIIATNIILSSAESLQKYVSTNGNILFDVSFSDTIMNDEFKYGIYFTIADKKSYEKWTKLDVEEKKRFLYIYMMEYLYLNLGVNPYLGYVRYKYDSNNKYLLLGKIAFKYNDSFEKSIYYIPDGCNEFIIMDIPEKRLAESRYYEYEKEM